MSKPPPKPAKPGKRCARRKSLLKFNYLFIHSLFPGLIALQTRSCPMPYNEMYIRACISGLSELSPAGGVWRFSSATQRNATQRNFALYAF